MLRIIKYAYSAVQKYGIFFTLKSHKNNKIKFYLLISETQLCNSCTQIYDSHECCSHVLAGKYVSVLIAHREALVAGVAGRRHVADRRVVANVDVQLAHVVFQELHENATVGEDLLKLVK